MVKLINSKQTIEKFFIYSIFLFIGLNVKFFSGFYLYNVLIVVFLVFFNKIKIDKNLFINIAFVDFIILFTLLIQLLYVDNFSLDSYYIFLNLVIFLTFIMFMKGINFRIINYNVVLVFLALPVIFSIFMFHNNSIENYLLSFYNLGKYPAFGRYGGVFGEDVNALGIFSSLLLFLTLVLKRLKMINFLLALFVVMLSLYAVILSGMRAGLLVIFVALLLFQIKLNILNFKYVLIAILGIILLVFNIYSINDNIKELVDYMINRFSIESLLQGVNINNDNGNLRVAIAYFDRTIENKTIDIESMLFGIDSNLNYVDNFYIFSFLKHGFVFILSALLVLFLIIKQAIIRNDYMVLLVVLISMVIALKGLFIINNYYMFTILFIINLWRNIEPGPNPNR